MAGGRSAAAADAAAESLFKNIGKSRCNLIHNMTRNISKESTFIQLRGDAKLNCQPVKFTLPNFARSRLIGQTQKLRRWQSIEQRRADRTVDAHNSSGNALAAA